MTIENKYIYFYNFFCIFSRTFMFYDCWRRWDINKRDVLQWCNPPPPNYKLLKVFLVHESITPPNAK